MESHEKMSTAAFRQTLGIPVKAKVVLYGPSPEGLSVTKMGRLVPLAPGML